MDNAMNPIISGSGTMSVTVMDIISFLQHFCINNNISSLYFVYTYRDCITPEHVGKRRISEKIDVYSFGVLVLEILSGKRNNGEYLDVYVSITNFYQLNCGSVLRKMIIYFFTIYCGIQSLNPMILS